MKLIFLCLVAISVFSLSAYACNPGENEIAVFIDADVWVTSDPTEWQLLDSDANIIDGGVVPLSNLQVVHCVPDGCYTFIITDGYGDGLINGGYYQVSYNGVIVATGSNFGYGASEEFGDCPPGSACDNPIIVSLGSYIASTQNNWYEFTPTQTGQYSISTCGNACDTEIWGYSYCSGLIWDDTNLATTFYASGGCTSQLEAQTSFLAEAGIPLYVRIGSVTASCNLGIDWSLSYLGPAVGCMDTNACNYEALATVSGPCLYPGDPQCPNGPDLWVLQSDIVNSLQLATVNSSSCYVQESCLQGAGTRQVLRFTTHIKNIGNEDYYIGPTPLNSNTPSTQFEWDLCHGHWHYEGYAEYLLYDTNGVEFPIGFKNGFCVLDLDCADGGTPKFTCSNMGITAGCGDIYDAGLPCQWIDLTTVPAGQYTFVVRINWDQSPDMNGNYETDYSNNWAQVCINIIRGGVNDAITAVNVVNNCELYIDCAGQAMGSAQPDCEGVCNGTHLAGDMDLNQNYYYDDALLLINQSLAGEGAEPCNDLNSDGILNVLDATQIYQCIQNDQTCSLPTTQITNFDHTVGFSLINLDPLAHYVDVQITNMLDSISAFQLNMSGLVISEIQNLIIQNNYSPEYYHNTSGEIIMVSPTGDPLMRFTQTTAVMRVFYSSITAPEICISSVTAAVNSENHQVSTYIGGCLNIPEKLYITVMLEKLFTGTSMVMRTDFLDNNLLPFSQPFDVAPYNYNGNELVSLINGFPENTTDWILIQLRDKNDPSQVNYERAALLSNTGEIKEINGTYGLNMAGVLPDQYYIAVFVRGHLGVISSVPIDFPTQNLYDFTTNLSQSMGNEQMKLGENGKYLLFCGDFDGNGVINNLDFNLWSTDGAAVGQYLSYDGDKNGVVNSLDYNHWYANRSKVGNPVIQF